MSLDIAEVVGVWLLRSCYVEDTETGQRMETFGPNPRGVLIIHPGGRMVALITPRDQAEPITEADKAAAYQSLLAYSGQYRFDPPDRFVTMVDVSWFQPWIGTAQARTCRFGGDTLDIVGAPTRVPWTKGLSIGVVSWVREAPPQCMAKRLSA